jgi:hypothetical protein
LAGQNKKELRFQTPLEWLATISSCGVLPFIEQKNKMADGDRQYMLPTTTIWFVQQVPKLI